MNVFRFAGEMTHLISILVLLLKIYATKSCSGAVYNCILGSKLVFIGSSLAIVCCMRFHRVVQRSNDLEIDTVRHYLLVGVSFLLALLVHEKFTCQEFTWRQLQFYHSWFYCNEVEMWTICFLSWYRAYRSFYILNWIYRYFTEQHFTRWISCVSGLLQTALYADFFYYYFISWKNNVKLKFPARDKQDTAFLSV